MDWNENIIESVTHELAQNQLGAKRWGVTITLHHSRGYSAIRETIYHNKGFPFHTFVKWKWYFRYRAAKFQVQNPYCFVELTTFDYEAKESSVELQKRVKDIIAARKRKVSMAKKNLADYEAKYQGLFPIENDEKYMKSKSVLARYEERLAEAEKTDFRPFF